MYQLQILFTYRHRKLHFRFSTQRIAVVNRVLTLPLPGASRVAIIHCFKLLLIPLFNFRFLSTLLSSASSFLCD